MDYTHTDCAITSCRLSSPPIARGRIPVAIARALDDGDDEEVTLFVGADDDYDRGIASIVRIRSGFFTDAY